MNSSTSRLLDRLARVKQTAPGCWMAACPICNSQKGRPVSVRESQDGRVLLYGWCGHGVGELLDALSLKLSDLFEAPLAHYLAAGPAPKLTAREALDLIDHEALVVGMLALELREDGHLWDEQWQRLAQAEARISWAVDASRAR